MWENGISNNCVVETWACSTDCLAYIYTSWVVLKSKRKFWAADATRHVSQVRLTRGQTKIYFWFPRGCQRLFCSQHSSLTVIWRSPNGRNTNIHYIVVSTLCKGEPRCIAPLFTETTEPQDPTEVSSLNISALTGSLRHTEWGGKSSPRSALQIQVLGPECPLSSPYS